MKKEGKGTFSPSTRSLSALRLAILQPTCLPRSCSSPKCLTLAFLLKKREECLVIHALTHLVVTVTWHFRPMSALHLLGCCTDHWGRPAPNCCPSEAGPLTKESQVLSACHSCRGETTMPGDSGPGPASTGCHLKFNAINGIILSYFLVTLVKSHHKTRAWRTIVFGKKPDKVSINTGFISNTDSQIPITGV